MSFLTPLFFLGALAAALPVILHLIRRTTRERRTFSSLMFLLPTAPRLTRRSRLEHILLLVLRCAVLCLLALAFARPFFQHPLPDAEPTAARRIIVLLDTSASMRRGTLWAEARNQAREVLRQAAPGDQAALVTFDRQIKPVLTFEEWAAAPVGERVPLATAKLAELNPGWASTSAGNALVQAAEMLADTGGKPAAGPGQIVLISDLQEGAHLESLQGYEWPKGVRVSLEPVKGRPTSNAALQLMADTDALAPAPSAAPNNVRVRVSNAGDSKREQFSVAWARADGRSVGKSVEVYVPPGQSRIVALPAPAGEAGLDRVVLQGDEEPFDNTVFVTPPTTVQASVLYFGSESANDSKQPLYFLERAFQETRRQTVRVSAHAPGGAVSPDELTTASLLMAAGTLPADETKQLRQQVQAGKTLLYCLRHATDATTLAGLLDLPSVEVAEVHPDNYAMLADIDFRHPLFAPFADARFSDFTKIHFWNYRRIDAAALPGGRVVARFDSGAPALVEVPIGSGRLVLLTSGWQPADSQLALSTKFVPMLYSLLETSGAPPPAPTQYRVGDVVPLAKAVGSPATTVRGPDGAQFALAAGAGQTTFALTATPGIYTLSAADGKVSEFAVNLDPAESRTAPLPPDEFERLGAPVGPLAPVPTTSAQRRITLHNAELENRQKLWRWAILSAIAVLLAETWLAGRTARRSVPQLEGANPGVF